MSAPLTAWRGSSQPRKKPLSMQPPDVHEPHGRIRLQCWGGPPPREATAGPETSLSPDNCQLILDATRHVAPSAKMHASCNGTIITHNN
jgi:hypothetical protein